VLLAAHAAQLATSVREAEDTHKIKQAVALREEAAAREQSRTDAHAQREAFASFHAFVAPWTYMGINGSDPLTCGDQTYTGPVHGVGSGAQGITVMLHRAQRSGPKVVAKFWDGRDDENLNHECNIFKRLARAGVTNVLTCEAACDHNCHTMIVVSPFVGGIHRSFLKELEPDFFDSPAALRRAVKETFRIGFSMLAAEVANFDQGHNILYRANGSATFIDMGLATYLRKAAAFDMDYDVRVFLEDLVAKVPASWWKNGQATEILREVTWPPTPKYFNDDPSGGFTERIRRQITAHGGDLNGLPTTPSKPNPNEPKPSTTFSQSSRIRSHELITFAGVVMLTRI